MYCLARDTVPQIINTGADLIQNKSVGGEGSKICQTDDGQKS